MVDKFATFLASFGSTYGLGAAMTPGNKVNPIARVADVIHQMSCLLNHMTTVSFEERILATVSVIYHTRLSTRPSFLRKLNGIYRKVIGPGFMPVEDGIENITAAVQHIVRMESSANNLDPYSKASRALQDLMKLCGDSGAEVFTEDEYRQFIASTAMWNTSARMMRSIEEMCGIGNIELFIRSTFAQFCGGKDADSKQGRSSGDCGNNSCTAGNQTTNDSTTETYERI